jgi:hypothetical protein
MDLDQAYLDVLDQHSNGPADEARRWMPDCTLMPMSDRSAVASAALA